ncbi:glycerophosphodiester phosphodiesterase [Pokkaliibacter plantistimulans]|uniref:Glycerophosphodiester phosphodiesterase n=1 Tax=Pokkaliibacter plantistimulans TaxID=1635171 RepID=A0ABX5LSV7_9GAMM|nr:glycerophosphoryl diester phosphodiesterase [Pokkaliibacter plantistimulans]PXF29282.1 glycerophosphodiester phosphodiesterase [Pokkaliibacter plantistimulans]
MQDVRVIGHRGAASLAPENTLASIRKAFETGATWVEIDVSVTHDGSLVIFHDDTLERCSNGKGLLEEASWDYLKSLDAGSWFDPIFSQERIPSLLDAVQLIQSLGMGLNLEIKYEGSDYPRIVDPTLALLNKYWQEPDMLVISSFNHGALLRCRALQCRYPLGQLYEGIPANWESELRAINAYSLHCDYSQLSYKQARAIKSAGYQLYCYTANEPELVAKHWAWGMDAIITDNPPAFLS